MYFDCGVLFKTFFFWDGKPQAIYSYAVSCLALSVGREYVKFVKTLTLSAFTGLETHQSQQWGFLYSYSITMFCKDYSKINFEILLWQSTLEITYLCTEIHFKWCSIVSFCDISVYDRCQCLIRAFDLVTCSVCQVSYDFTPTLNSMVCHSWTDGCWSDGLYPQG